MPQSDDLSIQIRLAEYHDIPGTRALLERYHANTLQGAQWENGFVTTDMSVEQFKALIDAEQGVSIAVDPHRNAIVGLLIGASWAFLAQWPMFEYMAQILPEYTFQGKALGSDMSYQYGPICIEDAYRGQGIGEKLIAFQKQQFSTRYPVMVTFINKLNPRSYRFHVRNAFEEVGGFEFNGNQYWMLAQETAAI